MLSAPEVEAMAKETMDMLSAVSAKAAEQDTPPKLGIIS
jgi:hypothetical protein